MEPVFGQLVYGNGLAAFFLQKMEGIFMATKNKIVNIKVFFDGDRDASQVFAEVIAQKIRDTKTKDKLAIMKDKQYNDYEFSNLKSA
jgi:hypothetical protein